MAHDKQHRHFEMDLEIAAPRAEVWQAISEARGLASWFAYRAEVEPGQGGRVLWDWPGHAWPLRIEDWKPGQALRLSYDSSVADGRGGKVPLYVDFELRGGGGTTTLRLVHHGFGPEASFDGEYDGISHGWPAELSSLKLYVERHLGRERMLAHKEARIASLDEGWRALTGPRGLAVEPGVEGLKPGDPFTCAFEGTERVEGRILTRSRGRFDGLTAQLTSLDDAFFHLWCEPGGGKPRAWIALSLYEGPPERIERIQRAFDGLFQRLFAEQPASGARA